MGVPLFRPLFQRHVAVQEQLIFKRSPLGLDALAGKGAYSNMGRDQPAYHGQPPGDLVKSSVVVAIPEKSDDQSNADPIFHPGMETRIISPGHW